ncbi:MAG: hypothetical protein A2664_04305 [Candidatus Taylorbacteria bacterium RIFCSPHIGHO2_01_FULL_46_22b]|uniref:Uncharacterized protein n=1 Tax=Candidatus Taylorbacteria bacterium RIFCSPHIGHO2_01_FULL_46_22b TaxID=1802301 RepID=A0A1G2M1N7_9BACT|nr:MAG: hypothetical protein A2664_04305 [Candidatus Taylorbacteria bacterium RIFCSPHIGHO2_01_FULL_46_22b]
MLLEHNPQFAHAFINILEFEPRFWFKVPGIIPARLATLNLVTNNYDSDIMTDKKAIQILKKMLDKKSLTTDERGAILTAIGVLGWTLLAEDRIKRIGKSRRAKMERDAQV